MHPVVRNLAVIVVSLIAIAFSVSDIVVPWHPYGVVGFDVSSDGTVVRVFPHSDVEKAGIQGTEDVAHGRFTKAALKHSLTIYDASYLHLAIATKCRLLSAYKKLQLAALAESFAS